eukprot:4049545-Prymnesium_polylepis.1
MCCVHARHMLPRGDGWRGVRTLEVEQREVSVCTLRPVLLAFDLCRATLGAAPLWTRSIHADGACAMWIHRSTDYSMPVSSPGLTQDV